MRAKIRLLPAARLLASPFSVALLAALAVILSLAVVRTATQRIALAAAVTRTEHEIAQLSADQQRLTDLVARLQSPQALESDARLRLNLAAPGETLTVLPEPQAAASAETITGGGHGADRWFDYFFSPNRT